MLCKLKTSPSIFPTSRLAACAPTASRARAPARTRRSLLWGLGLPGAVFGLTVGFGGIASQPAYAQEKQETKDGFTKEELELMRQFRYLNLRSSFKSMEQAKLDLNTAKACGGPGNSEEIEKLEKAVNDATDKFEATLDIWIANSENLTGEEKQAVQSFRDSGFYSYHEHVPEDRETREKYEKARNDFREKTKTLRTRLAKEVREGKELTLASPAECPTFVISPTPPIHGGGHG